MPHLPLSSDTSPVMFSKSSPKVMMSPSRFLKMSPRVLLHGASPKWSPRGPFRGAVNTGHDFSPKRGLRLGLLSSPRENKPLFSPCRTGSMASPIVQRSCNISPRSVSCSLPDCTPSMLFYPSYTKEWADACDEDVALNYLSPVVSRPQLNQYLSQLSIKTDQHIAERQAEEEREEEKRKEEVVVGTEEEEEEEEDEITQTTVDESEYTTLMMRNIPNGFTRERMLEEMKMRDVMREVDFFYMPGDARHRRNVGYCFVNLVSPDGVRRFRDAFEGLYFPQNGKSCAVCWGKVQGQQENIDAYHKSAFVETHNGQYQPHILDNGVILPFPPSTMTEQAILKPGERTFMLRNLPSNYTRDQLLTVIDNRGVLNYIDFLYVPIDMRHHRNVGYCFINVTCEEGVERFNNAFQGKWIGEKRCRVSLASLQGREANIEKYRHSPVHFLQECYQPTLLENGKLVAFPCPTLKHKEPRSTRRARMARSMS